MQNHEKCKPFSLELFMHSCSIAASLSSVSLWVPLIWSVKMTYSLVMMALMAGIINMCSQLYHVHWCMHACTFAAVTFLWYLWSLTPLRLHGCGHLWRDMVMHNSLLGYEYSYVVPLLPESQLIIYKLPNPDNHKVTICIVI